MKIKTNVRAGSGNSSATGVADVSSQNQNGKASGGGGKATNTVVTYVAPGISRCVGI